MHTGTKITISLSGRELTEDNLRCPSFRGTLRYEVDGKVVEAPVQCDVPQFDDQLRCTISLTSANA